MKAPDPEELAIRRLSNSPYLAAVVDSVLENLDRKTLTELVAFYLYKSSKGDANLGDLATHAASKGLWKWLGIATRASPAFIAGVLSDGDFRSVVLSFLRRWIRGPQERKVAEKDA